MPKIGVMKFCTATFVLAIFGASDAGKLCSVKSGGGTARNNIINPLHHWPGALVPYEIDGGFDDAAHKLISKALNHLEDLTSDYSRNSLNLPRNKANNSGESQELPDLEGDNGRNIFWSSSGSSSGGDSDCVSFVKRETEEDYLYFDPLGTECSSAIGKQGGRQVVHLGEGCLQLPMVLHQAMHALGFQHEHVRPGRDEHVIVMWDNIQKDKLDLFEESIRFEFDNQNIAYDFQSILHFPGNAYAEEEGAETLIRKESNEKIPENINLSPKDVHRIASLYEC